MFNRERNMIIATFFLFYSVKSQYAPSYKPTYKPTRSMKETPCNSDTDCSDGETCYRRINGEEFCHPFCPDDQSYECYVKSTYEPGNLEKYENGLLLSKGLSSRKIAKSNREIIDGKKFHAKPDAAHIFELENKQYVYLSNSEIKHSGGVGGIIFNDKHEVTDYKMFLENTNRNCGGGVSPWSTWLSCEEYANKGYVWEVSPKENFKPRRVNIVDGPGKYESVAYYKDENNNYQFFTTEDSEFGRFTRFVPNSQEHSGLIGNGQYHYLKLNDDGTFEFTRKSDATPMKYPYSEGVAVKDNFLYFVSKTLKKLFILDLKKNTYTTQSTENGIFSQQPDQVISSGKFIYFTEDGGKNHVGIHALDPNENKKFTILDSITSDYGESTGLAFSPDKLMMYVCFQDYGLFQIWRDDGKSFDNVEKLDIHFHRE